MRELAELVVAPRTAHRHLLAVGLAPAGGGHHRDRAAVGRLQPREHVELAQRRVGRVARAGVAQRQRAEEAPGQEEEVRDHLARVATLGAEPQPVGLDLPGARPGGVVDDDVDAQQIAGLTGVDGAPQFVEAARGGLGEVDDTAVARAPQLLDQNAAGGHVGAQRFFHEHALPGLRRGQRVGLARRRRAGQVDDVGAAHRGLRAVGHGQAGHHLARPDHRGGGRIPGADDLEVRVVQRVVQHPPAHDAQADEAHLVHAGLQCAPCWRRERGLSVRRRAGDGDVAVRCACRQRP